jgi:hypothetical protein
MFLKLFYRLLLMSHAFQSFSEIEVTFTGFEECWGLPLSLISETSYKEPDGYQAQPFVGCLSGKKWKKTLFRNIFPDRKKNFHGKSMEN